MNHTERERAIQKARSRALWADVPTEAEDITHCRPPHVNHSYLYGRCQHCEVLRKDAVAAQKLKRNAEARNRTLRSATGRQG